MGRADVYSQPKAPDPVLPAQLVWELARPHLPDEVRLAPGMEVDESGGEARVYLFDHSDTAGGVAVKTQRPHRLRPRTSLRKERRCSPRWPARSPAGSPPSTATSGSTPMPARSSSL